MANKISRRSFIARVLTALACLSPYQFLKAHAQLNAMAELRVADGLGGGEGKAFVNPWETTVGAVEDYEFNFIVGPSGIATGGSIRIDLPTCDTFHGLPSIVNWSEPQTHDPSRDSFVAVFPNDTGNVGVERVEHPKSKNYSYRIRLIALRQLNPDEDVRVVYKNARAQWVTQLAFFPIYTDRNGDGIDRRIQEVPFVWVKGGPAQKIRAVIPSVLGVDDIFDLRIVILDKLGFRASGYTGTITFQPLGILNNVPESYRFTKEDNSVHIFRGVSFRGVGAFVVAVEDGVISGYSNPSVVLPFAPPYKLYWGDMHWHSKTSDGLRSPIEGYLYARDISGLDFTAMTDHDAFIEKRNLWGYACAITNSFNATGRFVTFVAYEWTAPSALEGGPGHKNIYYPGDSGPLFSNLDPAASTPDGLWNCLEGLDALTIPHHVARSAAAADWSYRNDEFQRLVEIYSNHGNGEFHGAPPPFYEGAVGHYVQDALELGHRFGFVASTDCHYSFPGGSEELAKMGDWQALPALTAVYARALTRRDLFSQLEKRSCYATTGKRVILWVAINESFFMGSELRTAHAPMIHVMAASGRSSISKVEIIRDNIPIHVTYPDHNTCEFSFSDVAFSTLPVGISIYYYVRVELEDTFFLGEDEYHHLAWSSPIWVTKE